MGKNRAPQVWSQAATEHQVWFGSVGPVTQQLEQKRSLRDEKPVTLDNSPLREKRIDDSVSQRVDGQLRDPLEILSTADATRENGSENENATRWEENTI